MATAFTFSLRVPEESRDTWAEFGRETARDGRTKTWVVLELVRYYCRYGLPLPPGGGQNDLRRMENHGARLDAGRTDA